MSVLSEVEKVLDGRSDWRAETARVVARQIDKEPNASLIRELRSLIDAIGVEAETTRETPLDELRRRREAEGGSDPDVLSGP